MRAAVREYFGLLWKISLGLVMVSGLVYSFTHTAKEPQKPVDPLARPEQIRVSDGADYTVFTHPSDWQHPIYKFTDKETGNTLYWWDGKIMAVPGNTSVNVAQPTD